MVTKYQTKPATSFKYMGGKLAKMSWLLPLLRTEKEMSGFVDVCCGSASVALNWKANYGRNVRKLMVINDLSSDIHTFFKVLRDNPEELIKRIQLTPFSREEFDALCKKADPADLDEVETARRFYVLINQGFGGQPSFNGCAWGRSKVTAVPVHITDPRDALQSIAADCYHKNACEKDCTL